MNMLTTITGDPAIGSFGTTGHRNPVEIVWPPTLPIELALKVAPNDQIRQEYGYSREEWNALPQVPAFIRDLTAACEMVRQEGMSFKLKARLIAEDNLKALWRMVHEDSNKETPPAVKAKLMELCARWGHYDPKSLPLDGSAASTGNAVNIQINLGADY